MVEVRLSPRTVISVQALTRDSVYIERVTHGNGVHGSLSMLNPRQARELGKALIAAAKETEGLRK